MNMVRAARLNGLGGSSSKGFNSPQSRVCERFETVPVLLMPDWQAAHHFSTHAAARCDPSGFSAEMPEREHNAMLKNRDGFKPRPARRGPALTAALFLLCLVAERALLAEVTG
jgi:hypothetical protein